MNRPMVIAGLVLAVMVSLLVFARPVDAPAAQPGTPLDGGVVVVYSAAYRPSFFGLERFHPADIMRYERVAQHLQDEGLLEPEDFLIPEAVSDAELQLVHDRDYLERLYDFRVLSRALELPIPPLMGRGVIDRRILEPFRRAVGGTLAAFRGALAHGVGINLGGGFHHARPALGHGFCVYNDVALAIATLRQEGFEGRVLIVDTDAHQGDGNHAFFSSDRTVTSFSMHQQGIFPHPKLIGDLDIPLVEGMQDEPFLALLAEHLETELLRFEPALVVHVAGADVLVDDPLASLAISVEGLIARDWMVARMTRSKGIPLVHLLAGGYGPSSAQAQGRSVAGLLEGTWQSSSIP